MPVSQRVLVVIVTGHSEEDGGIKTTISLVSPLLLLLSSSIVFVNHSNCCRPYDKRPQTCRTPGRGVVPAWFIIDSHRGPLHNSQLPSKNYIRDTRSHIRIAYLSLPPHHSTTIALVFIRDGLKALKLAVNIDYDV